ncbi:MAG TPA: hypothetical protein QGF58_21085 [Myxococcota bacterium]|nr:hypothetical protein [Myxococcota bacterium]
MSTLLLIFGLLMGLVASPAHAKDMKLDYRVEIDPVTATGKRVAVEFVDVRDEWAGTERLGHVRAGAGFPYSLNNAGMSIEAFYTKWLEDSLEGAGYTIDPTAPETARLTLEYFWIEGYMVYDVHIKMRVDLVADRGVIATKSFDRRFEERLDWTVNELNKPINTMLQQVGEEIVGWSYSWDLGGKAIAMDTPAETTEDAPLVVDEPVIEDVEAPPEGDEISEPSGEGNWWQQNKKLIIILAIVAGAVVVSSAVAVVCCCCFGNLYGYY